MGAVAQRESDATARERSPDNFHRLVRDMLLLQIADIHFREPDCTSPDTDPERPYRTLLLQSARTETRAMGGTVGAIVVGGDIAFKGDTQEYAVAAEWLKALADATGCPHERIFVVPGNHDVDRRTILRTPAVRNAQGAVARSDEARRERELRTQFSDPHTSGSLLLPLTAYNEFAKFFNCQVYSPDRLYWKQDLELQNGLALRIFGLTSVLLSGQDGKDDARGSLYLSPLQTTLNPADNVVNLVLCHHPPDWLMDQDDVHDAFCNRAHIHLLGHKHRQRITQARNYVRFSAGAVNPDRQDLNWQPGYNLIEVTSNGRGDDRTLTVRSKLMAYRPQPPEGFQAVRPSADTEFYVDTFNIPEPQKVAVSLNDVGSASASETVVVTAESDPEAQMSDEGTRNLIYRFWNLSMSQRREIVLALGLLENGELALPEPERYGRALLRAGERNLLGEFAKQVAAKEGH